VKFLKRFSRISRMKKNLLARNRKLHKEVKYWKQEAENWRHMKIRSRSRDRSRDTSRDMYIELQEEHKAFRIAIEKKLETLQQEKAELQAACAIAYNTAKEIKP